MLQALALAGAQWETERDRRCTRAEHGQLAILVQRDGEPSFDRPRCGCGDERPARIINLVVAHGG